jgi:ribosomal protein L40E
MQCPKCQAVNSDKAKFCLECGQKLDVKCPQCGHSASPSAKFCDECGYDFTKTSAITPQPLKLHLSQLLQIKSASTSLSCSATSPDTQP